MIIDSSPSTLGVSLDFQKSDRKKISIPDERITIELPSAEALAEAFEQISGLQPHLKPVAIEKLAKRLSLSKKTIEDSYCAWVTETREEQETQQEGEV
jgi:hypothetical protein